MVSTFCKPSRKPTSVKKIVFFIKLYFYKIDSTNLAMFIQSEVTPPLS